jgi:8-oxo-dGTP pyrophosphatase MutT (NUDIX family)
MLDLRLKRLSSALEARQRRIVEREAVHVETAVAVVLRATDALEVLLIRRTEREGDPWSGHVAFPGGRRSAGDIDLTATALRETEEETGIGIGRVGRILGSLDEVEPGTRRLPPVIVAPFVVAVPVGTLVVPNPAEVLDAEWVPLEALRRQEAMSELRLRRNDVEMTFPAIVHGDYVIWGLTHRILGQFLSLAEEAGL